MKKNVLSMSEIKIILRCADEVVARGGRSILAKILKGSKDKKILELKLESCPGYGFYGECSIEEITSKIDWMIKYGYLKIEYDYRLPFLYFTEIGCGIWRKTHIPMNYSKN